MALPTLQVRMKKIFLLFGWVLFMGVSVIAQTTPSSQYSTVADMVQAGIPSVPVSGKRITAFVTGRNTANDGGGGTFYYDEIASSSTNLGTIFKPSASAGRWVRQYSGEIKLEWFGVKGDNSTDNTTAFTSAFSIASNGSKYTLETPGTYIVNNASVTPAIKMVLAPGVILKHKSSSSAAMFKFNGGGEIQGGVWDGNKAGNAATNVWFETINFSGPFKATDCYFTNYVYSGVRSTNLNGEAHFTRCEFRNGAEHFGVTSYLTTAASFVLSASSIAARVVFEDCTIEQDSAASSAGYGPGGIIINGALDNDVALEINHCWFNRIGQSRASNFISPIDCYKHVKHLKVVNSTILNTDTQPPIRGANIGESLIAGNTITGFGTSGVNISTSQQWDGTFNTESIIAQNLFTDGGAAIYLFNAETNFTDYGSYSILGNTATNVTHFIEVNVPSVTDFMAGEIKIGDNTAYAFPSTEAAINIDKFAGSIGLFNNTVHADSGLAIGASQNVSNAVFRIEGGYYHNNSTLPTITIRGASNILAQGFTIKNDNASGDAYQLVKSGSDQIKILRWEDISILGGIEAIAWADVDELIGTFRGPTGDPEGVIPARPGRASVWNTSSGNMNGYMFRKTTGSGLGRTGWTPDQAIHRNDKSGVTQTSVQNLSTNSAAASEFTAVAAGTQGSFKAWGTNYVSSWLQGWIGPRAESTAQGIAMDHTTTNQSTKYFFAGSDRFDVFYGGTYLNGYQEMLEMTAPGTPAANKVRIYPKSDGKMYSKDDAGTETPMYGSGTPITIEEQDGSPTGTLSTLKVSNGTLTDNGGGTFSLVTGGGGGGGWDPTGVTTDTGKIKWLANVVTTTDSSPHNIASITLTSNVAYWIEVQVVIFYDNLGGRAYTFKQQFVVLYDGSSTSIAPDPASPEMYKVNDLTSSEASDFITVTVNGAFFDVDVTGVGGGVSMSFAAKVDYFTAP